MCVACHSGDVDVVVDIFGGDEKRERARREMSSSIRKNYDEKWFGIIFEVRSGWATIFVFIFVFHFLRRGWEWRKRKNMLIEVAPRLFVWCSLLLPSGWRKGKQKKKFSNQFCLSNINITVTYFTTHLSSLSLDVEGSLGEEEVQGEHFARHFLLPSTKKTIAGDLPRGSCELGRNLYFYYPHHGNVGVVTRKGWFHAITVEAEKSKSMPRKIYTTGAPTNT